MFKKLNIKVTATKIKKPLKGVLEINLARAPGQWSFRDATIVSFAILNY